MRIFKFIFQDTLNNRYNTKGKIITVLFRLANYAFVSKSARIILIPYLLFYKFVVEWLFCVEIPPKLKVGKGLMIYHGFGIVIHEKCIIGENVKIRHNTTIGNSQVNGECPIIGNNVEIGANTVIIGNIEVGNNSIIGAGSVVISDVPPNSLVVGNPGRIVKIIE
jgi:serine acetyltransferase